MNTLDQLRGQIAAAKSEINTIKLAPATPTETRKAVEAVLNSMEHEWLQFEELLAQNAANIRPGNRITIGYIAKELPLSAAIHFNREVIAKAIMERQMAIRAETGLPPALSEQDRDASLKIAALNLYALELEEANLLESLPDLPRPDANPFAMLGLPVETAGPSGIFYNIG